MSAIFLDDIPDCAVLADGAGRILAANVAAGLRFGAQLEPGRFGPWFEQRHGWSFKDRADGSQLALFRPDADETARAKTMLFATLSHEIRTPLNGILGMAGLIAMSELTPAQRSWLDAVQDSGQHLLGLINDILDYAKLESGKIELEALDFDPVHTAQSIAELCSPRARERGLEIAVAVGAGVPARVRGDDGRLRQILLNLVSNAVKFTETGGVLIRISTEAGSDRLRFAVEDTGIGIPPDKAGHVFEEFAQADSSHARRYGGTGLGLAIVRKLAAALGGEVGYAPRAGGGSCFVTTVPLPPVAQEAGAALAPAGPGLAGRIVAVATASDVLFEAIAANLAAEGAAVKRAASPRAVRGACVLLLDHGLAEGAEASWVRTGRPLVALIPQERRDLIDTWRDSGAAGYLIKPLRRASLLERVRLAAEAGALAAQAEGGAAQAGAARDERAEARRPALGLRVLLAEDNPVNALLARALLQRSGCETVVVGTGEEALRALEAAPYDLVLMDVHMPVLDGYAATRALRAAGGRLAATPVVALTAAAMEEDRRACLAAGMDDFITKPLDPERLAAVLERWSAGRGADAIGAAGAVAA
jgi:signal transduction histidine kinase/CheY-like chemotaxis protein